MNGMVIGNLPPFETACAFGGLILGSCIYAAVESRNQRNNTYWPLMESFLEALGIMVDEKWKEKMDIPPIERCLRMMSLTCFGGALGFISGLFCGFIWPIFGLVWPILTIPLMASIFGLGASYIKIEIAKK